MTQHFLTWQKELHHAMIPKKVQVNMQAYQGSSGFITSSFSISTFFSIGRLNHVKALDGAHSKHLNNSKPTTMKPKTYANKLQVYKHSFKQ